MQSIQEIYQENILPLGEDERLKLIELIVRDITRSPKTNKDRESKGIREMFGMWEAKKNSKKDYQDLDHNEQIDFDLAQAYADNHEDED